jgi:nitrilase
MFTGYSQRRIAMKRESYRVAAVQASPIFLDLEKSIEKAVSFIEKAASEGAALVAFPEVYLPGYPWWIWLDAPAWGMQFVRRYFENSLVLGSAEAARINEAAARNDIFVLMGFSERSGGSLYIAQALINNLGETVFARRKLKPTHAERTVFGEGDGSHLRVYETDLGRIGAFNCAEHLQPLSKYAMYAQNEQVHIASWPSFSLYRGRAYSFSADLHNPVSQVYAAEGQCFVLAPCATVSKETVQMLADEPKKEALLLEGGGFTRIYGPDGSPLAQALPEKEEGILYADIDLGVIALAKAAFDPVGHYSRPDVTRLLLNQNPTPVVEYYASKRSVVKVQEAAEGTKEGPLEWNR